MGRVFDQPPGGGEKDGEFCCALVQETRKNCSDEKNDVDRGRVPASSKDQCMAGEIHRAAVRAHPLHIPSAVVISGILTASESWSCCALRSSIRVLGRKISRDRIFSNLLSFVSEF